MLLKTEVSPQKEKGENNAIANAIYFFLYLFLKKEKTDDNAMFAILLYK